MYRGKKRNRSDQAVVDRTGKIRKKRAEVLPDPAAIARSTLVVRRRVKTKNPYRLSPIGVPCFGGVCGGKAYCWNQDREALMKSAIYPKTSKPLYMPPERTRGYGCVLRTARLITLSFTLRASDKTVIPAQSRYSRRSRGNSEMLL
jgi:hypothetical protein